jgi:uncharacterized protein
MQSKLHLQDFVISMLKSYLPADYYYHNYLHTLYVQGKAIEIGIQENCTSVEIELLSAAALFHDTGYIYTYARHEEESCMLAKQHLPAFGFLAHEITAVCGMIMATKIPQSPQNKLEEIIADADMEYLGTNHAEAMANDLFRELHSLNPLLTKNEWDRTQVLFLQQHHYFTNYCKKYKEPAKCEYFNQLREALH